MCQFLFVSKKDLVVGFVTCLFLSSSEKEHQSRNQNEVSHSFLLFFMPLMCTLLKICHLAFSQAEQIGHPLYSFHLDEYHTQGEVPEVCSYFFSICPSFNDFSILNINW